MPTRNVVLTDRQASMIESLVESGRYQNASEVMRDGLRLIESRLAEDAAKLAALRAAVRVGDDDFARGAFTSFADTETLMIHLNDIADRAIGDPENNDSTAINSPARRRG